jgi:hypothetical protein
LVTESTTAAKPKVTPTSATPAKPKVTPAAATPSDTKPDAEQNTKPKSQTKPVAQNPLETPGMEH